MIKNKKKNKLLYAALSLVISIMLWMVALNEQNPVVTRNMTNVDVNIIGQESISAKKLVILEENLTVNLKLKGPVLTVGTINDDNIKVSIDVTNINASGAYNIPVNVTGLPYGAQLSGINPSKVSINVDNLITLKMPVTVNSVGALENNLSVFALKPLRDTINVTGPQSVIEKINNISTTVNLNGIDKDTVLDEVVFAYTKEGEKIENVTFDEDVLKIQLLTGLQKTVDATVSVQGRPADDYAISSLEADPDKVEIITRDPDINNISVVAVLSGSENADVTISGKYNIDENVVLIVNPPKINITVKIKPIN